MSQRVPNWCQKRAHLTPDREALICEGRIYTFGEVYRQALGLAGRLRAAGLTKGSLAAVLLASRPESVFLLYALQMLGVRTVVLNNRLTAAELSWQVEDSGAEMTIVDDDLADKVGSLDGRVIAISELARLREADPEVQGEYDLGDVTTIMYTSGTTGRPKGVLQTYGNHLWSAAASALNLGLHGSDRWLCAVPVFHISGYSILMKSLIYGMPVVLHRSFDEERAIADIRRHGVTIMSVVSTMLRRILARLGEERLPESFRCMLLGGGPAPLPLLEECVRKGIPVFQTYGMTETASQVATLSPEYCIRKLGSAGKALFFNEIRIVGRDGREAAPLQEGEIAVRGPTVTPGYLNREAETAERIRDGWLLTGDVGYLDEEGFLYVLDRRSDLIISGGENIYPAEIESVLLSHPAIADAGVIGIDDEEWGQVPAAFLVRAPGANVGEEELLTFCRERLARYKLPRRFVFVGELPRNASNKLLRHKLREAWKAGDGVREA